MDRTWQPLYDAFRQAGAEVRGRFRRQELGKGGPLVCPITLRRLDESNAWVHHEDPFSLQQILFLFLSNEGLKREDVEIGTVDGGPQLVCENLRARWVAYYKSKARLRLVHKSSDLRQQPGDRVRWAALYKGPTVVVGEDRMRELEEAGSLNRLDCRVAEWGKDRRPLGWHVPKTLIESPPAPRKPKPKARRAPAASCEVAAGDASER